MPLVVHLLSNNPLRAIPSALPFLVAYPLSDNLLRLAARPCSNNPLRAIPSALPFLVVYPLSDNLPRSGPPADPEAGHLALLTPVGTDTPAQPVPATAVVPLLPHSDRKNDAYRR